jgi:NAD(P)-dependent dehydrogenase (short-subunit alcohol dehydrogenase family)
MGMMIPLQDRVAVVTGAGRGIGQAVTSLFAQAGARTIGVSRSADQINAATAALVREGHDAHGLALDVAQESAWREIAAAAQRLGRWDILVNGAGIGGPMGPLETVVLSEWEDVFRTNVTGTMLGCRTAVTAMRPTGSGVIINVASSLARRVQSGLSAYSATKAAVIQLSAVLAAEVQPDGLQVFSVHPGIVDTEMSEMLKEQIRKSPNVPGAIGPRLSSPELLTPTQSALLFLLLATGTERALNGQFVQFDEPQLRPRAQALMQFVEPH